MRKVAVFMFSLFVAFSAHSALALTCKSGTADCSKNQASDCTALGYTSDNVANCKHYLYCPFNTNYKACIAVTDSGTECESKGYSTNKPTETGYLCKDVTVALNGVNKTCYDCVTCKDEFLITSKTCQQICENFSIDDQSYSYYKISTITSINNRTGGPCYSGMLSTHKSDCCCNGKSSVILAKCEEPTELTDCSDYPLTECPEHGVCDKCPDDNSYKKLTGCELGYTLNTSKTGCELSISCTDQYKELNQLAAVAEKSYFNCCKSTAIAASNVCRTFKNNSTDGCLSKRNGAWDDGCFSYFEKIIDNDSDLEIGTDFSTITEAITACKAKLQNIKDAISSHNYICPNNKITDNINTSNCDHVWFKGDVFGDIDKNLSVDYRGCPEGYSGTGGK